MRGIRGLWRVLKQVAGEGEYARYCAHLRSCHPEIAIPSEKEFYLDRLNEKYARPSRCC